MNNLTFSRNTTRAINKYGKTNCLNFFDVYIKFGDGANTMCFGTKYTTQQMDAMINAGQEIQESK